MANEYTPEDKLVTDIVAHMQTQFETWVAQSPQAQRNERTLLMGELKDLGEVLVDVATVQHLQRVGSGSE